MKTTITLIDKQNRVRTAPIGFSWTTLFFGLIPALTRSDWKWALIEFVLAPVTFGLSWLVMPFLYNKFYIKDLLASGYYPVDNDMAKQIVSAGIVSLDQMRMYKKLAHPESEFDAQPAEEVVIENEMAEATKN